MNAQGVIMAVISDEKSIKIFLDDLQQKATAIHSIEGLSDKLKSGKRLIIWLYPHAYCIWDIGSFVNSKNLIGTKFLSLDYSNVGDPGKNKIQFDTRTNAKKRRNIF